MKFYQLPGHEKQVSAYSDALQMIFLKPMQFNTLTQTICNLKVKNDNRSKFSDWKQLERRSGLKKSGSSTGFEPVTSAIPVRAQLAEHRTGIAEVTGSNPVEDPDSVFSDFFYPFA